MAFAKSTFNKVLNLTSTAALVLRFNATLPQNNHLRFGKLARRYSTLCVTVVTGSFVNYKDLKGHIYVYNYNLRNRSK
jgi:hypothetical protein